mmetsp:Transcript_2506/g.3881  ORF Transcript_2506/g.3881 Transcript_2506/m.3881 type:complete len:96 (-) Transcript_2506:1133-1420(-)
MIHFLLKAYSQIKRLKYDIKIIPVCMSHDRDFDVNLFARETLNGEHKPELSMLKALRIYKGMRRGQLGKMFVKFADPIDLNSYINEFSSKQTMRP